MGMSLAVLLAQKNEVTALDIVPERVDLVNARGKPRSNSLRVRHGVLLCAVSKSLCNSRRHARRNFRRSRLFVFPADSRPPSGDFSGHGGTHRLIGLRGRFLRPRHSFRRILEGNLRQSLDWCPLGPPRLYAQRVLRRTADVRVRVRVDYLGISAYRLFGLLPRSEDADAELVGRAARHPSADRVPNLGNVRRERLRAMPVGRLHRLDELRLSKNAPQPRSHPGNGERPG